MLKNTLLTLFIFVATLGKTKQPAVIQYAPTLSLSFAMTSMTLAPFMGDTLKRSLRMSGFAESAVTFQHAYSNNPVCAPSRASITLDLSPYLQQSILG